MRRYEDELIDNYWALPGSLTGLSLLLSSTDQNPTIVIPEFYMTEDQLQEALNLLSGSMNQRMSCYAINH